MKKIPLLIALLFLCISSQAQCLVNSLIINTGYDATTGLGMVGGANGATPVPDPKWTVTAESPEIALAIAATTGIPGLIEVTLGAPADVVTTRVGWASDPTSRWIDCVNTNLYITDGSSATNYSWTLARQFRTCADDSIKLDIYVANDNYIPSMNIDGTLLSFSQTAGLIIPYLASFTHFTQTVYLTAGTHTYNVVQNNWGAAGYNGAGIDLYGTLSSAAGTNSIVSETPACSTYVCLTPPPPCNTVSIAPDSLHLCVGDTATIAASISGTDSVWSAKWSPVTGLSDTLSLDPVLTAGASGWYSYTVKSLSSANLLVNGDFSAGSSGFTTSYTLLTTPTGTSAAGSYSVGTNPYPWNFLWPVMGDHTTGTGNMLLLNGSTTSGTVFWSETVPVTSGTDYLFSMWSAALYSPLSTFQLQINGVAVGSTFTPLGTIGVWNRAQLLWNSGTATTAILTLSSFSTADVGNDVAIDDIAFQSFCIAKDSVYAAVSPITTITSHNDTTACASGTITLNAPAGYTSPVWNTGATTASISVGTGTYWVRSSVACTIKVDTFHVTITGVIDTVANHVDTAFCSLAGSATLHAPALFTSPTWSTGATTASITVSAGGTYWVSTVLSCILQVDTFHVTETAPSISTLTSDTSICAGASATLHAPAIFTGYLWSTGATSSSILISAAGSYWVTDANVLACSIQSDTFHVTETAPSISTHISDTGICADASVTLHAPAIFTDYSWSTGATSSSILVSAAGTYWVTDTNVIACSIQIDTFLVTMILVPISLGNDTSICAGNSLTLSSPSSTGTYLWNTGSTDSSITISAGGEYILTVTNNGCIAADSINISEVSKPLIDLGPDLLICSGSTIVLSTGDANTHWSTGKNGASIVVFEEGIYWASETYTCGTIRDSIKIDVGDCTVAVPTAFSPNDDGSNDILYVRGAGIKTLDFRIYNRWGQAIFITDNQSTGWDGTYQGQKQPIDVYGYTISATMIDGTTKTVKGNVTLLR